MKSVLFVDDDRSILDSLRRAFRKEPFHSIFATSVSEAIQILESTEIGVVVTDYSMPQESGLTLLSAASVSSPNAKKILMSGEANLPVVTQALNSHEIIRFFPKPCDAIQLGGAIREALGIGDLEKSKRARLYKATIAELERKNPGISEVKRDEQGRILVDD